MNRNFFTLAFVLGAMAIVWVGAGFLGTNLVALTMTVLIAAVYGLGAMELRQFRHASASLSVALTQIPETLTNLGAWLGSVHPSVQNAVRLRVEGERVGLPGPALTPYLVGLLVMLGMLGTFLGMVVTLNGAAFSLEGTTDLQAIRAALAAPIKGLGLAFGTSVAGVAASAMLGLMSALSRRERVLVAQQLDTQIAGSLRLFSLSHQRQEAYKALQSQAQALPAVVSQLQVMMTQMERMGGQLNERLLSNQDGFHQEVKTTYRELASSVEQSLKDSLTQSARVAGEGIKPLVEAAMAGMAQEARVLHERMIETAQGQLDGLSSRFKDTTSIVSDTWTTALVNHERSSASMVQDVGQALMAFAQGTEQRSNTHLLAIQRAYTDLLAQQARDDQQRQSTWTNSLSAMAETLQTEWQAAGTQTLTQQQQICSTLTETAQQVTAQAQASASNTLSEITRLMACTEALINARMTSEAHWAAENSERMAQLASLLRSELGALREDEAQRGHAAVDRLGELQTEVTTHLATLGTALEAPIKRLIETASEAPRAAADVIGQLRQEMSGSLARDNALLEERARILETLNSLLDGIQQASAEQRSVIDALVASAAVTLTTAGHQFEEQVGAETAKLSDIAAHVTGSAVEVSSLGEAFGFAVSAFNEGNEKLITHLQRVEAAMDKSMARSDDQLAYYVAQAREVIDLSVMSQKEVFEELRQLSSRQALMTQEAS